MPTALVVLLVVVSVGLLVLLLHVFGALPRRGRSGEAHSVSPAPPPEVILLPPSAAVAAGSNATSTTYLKTPVPQATVAIPPVSRPFSNRPPPADMAGIGLESGAGRYLPRPAATEDTAPPICPNCRQELNKRPKRKSACPLCGETIFVKYTPRDPVKRLVDAARLAEIEVEWAAYHEEKARQRTDVEAAMFDIPPGLSNEEIVAGMKAFAENPRREIHLRRLAASAVARASSGRERAKWAANRYRLDLESFLEGGFTTVTLRGGGDPCSSCKALVGKVFSTAEAKAKHPVPNRKCYRWKEHGDCCAFWALPKM